MAINFLSRNFAKLSPNAELYSKVKEKYYVLFKSTNCMPVMLRFAWHDAGTYDAKSNTGGPNGSIRFDAELSHNSNNGLDYARTCVNDIQKDFTNVSYADLIQIGGTTAVEYCKGPIIPFRFGRVDAKDDTVCTELGRLPDGSKGVSHLRDIFYRMGLNDVEIVALSGGHTIGRAHKDRSGWEGPWTKNENTFDNSYFVELLGRRSKALLRLPTDEALLTEPTMKFWVEKFAKDSSLFFQEYAKAHKKLSELGNE